MMARNESFVEGKEAGPPLALPHFGHIHRHWDEQHQVYMAKILPGEYYVTIRGEGVATVLGSCVSACVRDYKLGVGGMNHFMLPAKKHEEELLQSMEPSVANRYGNHAMESLINDILKCGGRRENLDVKIIGGGRILENMTKIGRMNIEFVRTYIKTEGLRLIGEDVGDIYPRKVVYFPALGRVLVKKLYSMRDRTIIESEQNYCRTLDQEPVSGDVELF